MNYREAADLIQIAEPLLADETALREAFRHASKTLHPDAGGDADQFSLLQQAQRLFLRPGERLRSWLEVHQLAGDVRGSLSNDLMDRFIHVAEMVQRAQSLAKESDACRSTLAKALLEKRRNQIREEIATFQADLTTLVSQRCELFPAIADGKINPASAWQTVRDLLFLEKWQAQLREEFARTF